MHGCVAILNVGSLSLTFGVHGEPDADDWHLEFTGQSQAFGTPPQPARRDALSTFSLTEASVRPDTRSGPHWSDWQACRYAARIGGCSCVRRRDG